MSEIESQVVDMEKQEVEELTLDSIHFGKFTKELKEKIESFTNLCSLTLNDCQLKSLANFPNLPKLAKLELIDNQLPASVLNELPNFPDLQSLSLGGNKIQVLDEVMKLKKYTQLVELDFLGCDITSIEDYRKKIFTEFPNLIILDNADKEGNEVDLEDDDGEDDGEHDDDDLDSEDDENDEAIQNIDDDEEEEEEPEDDEESEEEPQPQKKQKK